MDIGTPKLARSVHVMILAAAAILMVTMGIRQSMGLFVSPLNTSTGLGITTISLAFAVAQFMWGAVQPVAAALADRYGSARVLAAGVILLALGMALTPFMTAVPAAVPGPAARARLGGPSPLVTRAE